MSSKGRVLVVGAGITGATAARLLAEKGYEVIVYEKNDSIGGICSDEFYIHENKNHYLQKYGPHIFHTNKKYIYDFIERFSIINKYKHKVIALDSFGESYQYPINNNALMKVFNPFNNPAITIPIIKQFIKEDIKKNKSKETDFSSVMINKIGSQLFYTFIYNYSKKQWGNLEKISSSLSSRLPIKFSYNDYFFNDQYQGIPISGFSSMIQKMLTHPNIRIETNTEFNNNLPFNTTGIIYTGRLDEFFNYQYGILNYYSTYFELRDTMNAYSLLDSYATLNFIGNEEKFTRITNCNKFMFKEYQSSKTIIEHPLQNEYDETKNLPLYPAPTSENNKRRNKYYSLLKKIQKNIIVCGRLGLCKYLNMDEAIESAFIAVKKF